MTLKFIQFYIRKTTIKINMYTTHVILIKYISTFLQDINMRIKIILKIRNYLDKSKEY